LELNKILTNNFNHLTRRPSVIKGKDIMIEKLIIAKRGYKIAGASVTLINKSVEDNWLTQDFGIWCWDEKHHNYLAIVTRDENGEDKFNWLKKSKNSDEYFNISKVKKGDILLAGSKRRNKGYSEKEWYGVVDKTEESLVLVKETTYLKVKKLLNDIEVGDVIASELNEYYIIKNISDYKKDNIEVLFSSQFKREYGVVSDIVVEWSYDGKDWNTVAPTIKNTDEFDEEWKKNRYYHSLSCVIPVNEGDLYLRISDNSYYYYPDICVHLNENGNNYIVID
jgi:hypothetical protein